MIKLNVRITCDACETVMLETTRTLDPAHASVAFDVNNVVGKVLCADCAGVFQKEVVPLLLESRKRAAQSMAETAATLFTVVPIKPVQ